MNLIIQFPKGAVIVRLVKDNETIPVAEMKFNIDAYAENDDEPVEESLVRLCSDIEQRVPKAFELVPGMEDYEVGDTLRDYLIAGFPIIQGYMRVRKRKSAARREEALVRTRETLRKVTGRSSR